MREQRIRFALLLFGCVLTAGIQAQAEIGPGVPARAEQAVPFSDGGDNYLKYQWGLHNFGQLQIDAQKLKKTEYGMPGETADPAAAALNGIVMAQSGVDIGMLEAWELYAAKPEKREVVVAIIDTGVDISHPELADALWVNADEIPGDGIDNDGNGYIDDINGWNFYSGDNYLSNGIVEYHGTHAAGTIAAKRGNGGIAGITDNRYVKIMPLKVLGVRGTGKDQMVAEAIRYAEANGADICNLSFGGSGFSEAVYNAMRESQMLFVAAAGNGDEAGKGYSIDEKPVYPAAYDCDNLIAVSNLGFDGRLHSSSNYGAQTVDMAAPGSYILGLIPDGEYAFLTGTSMAAPYVTAVAAMAYSYRTDLALSDIKALLMRNVRKLDSLNGLNVSGGMVDAARVLRDSGRETETEIA